MYKTLSGREVSDALLISIKRRVEKLDRKPTLGIVLVGNDPASQVYVSMKVKKAASAGVDTRLHKLPENAKEEELLSLVDKLNNDTELDGFIVQSPLPRQIDGNKVIEAISTEKDVDGWTSKSLGGLFLDAKRDDIF
ncbi:MAG: tetrahydrofolate dehydrogenase/cyclohydrolase catalytic domain-containing protein, partial [Candidatus Micrarchaeota archaeon]